MANPNPLLTLRDLLIPGLSAVTSFAGAWLAAQLALKNFYQQKTWEQKAVAYTAIFEAIHAVDRWYGKHFDASIAGKEMDEERKTKLRTEANKAEEDLERRLAGQAWLIPSEFHARAMKMTGDLEIVAGKHTEWVPFLNESLGILDQATKELLEIARADLKLSEPWYRRLFRQYRRRTFAAL